MCPYACGPQYSTVPCLAVPCRYKTLIVAVCAAAAEGVFGLDTFIGDQGGDADTVFKSQKNSLMRKSRSMPVLSNSAQIIFQQRQQVSSSSCASPASHCAFRVKRCSYRTAECAECASLFWFTVLVLCHCLVQVQKRIAELDSHKMSLSDFTKLSGTPRSPRFKDKHVTFVTD
jgi:hypothetical protein